MPDLNPLPRNYALYARDNDEKDGLLYNWVELHKFMAKVLSFSGVTLTYTISLVFLAHGIIHVNTKCTDSVESVEKNTTDIYAVVSPCNFCRVSESDSLNSLHPRHSF
jgi:hypothetical protein